VNVNAAYICFRSGVEKVLIVVSIKGSGDVRPGPGGVDDARLVMGSEMELEVEWVREGMDEDEDSESEGE
jgi:hypothetical protein